MRSTFQPEAPTSLRILNLQLWRKCVVCFCLRSAWAALVALRSRVPELVGKMFEMLAKTQENEVQISCVPSMSIFSSRKCRCLSTLKFNTTPVKPVACTKIQMCISANAELKSGRPQRQMASVRGIYIFWPMLSNFPPICTSMFEVLLTYLCDKGILSLINTWGFEHGRFTSFLH